jgi:hypothetical protein
MNGMNESIEWIEWMNHSITERMYCKKRVLKLAAGFVVVRLVQITIVVEDWTTHPPWEYLVPSSKSRLLTVLLVCSFCKPFPKIQSLYSSSSHTTNCMPAPPSPDSKRSNDDPFHCVIAYSCSRTPNEFMGGTGRQKGEGKRKRRMTTHWDSRFLL